MTSELQKSEFDQLSTHIGHQLELVGYGKHGKPPWVDLAIECHDCDAVIANWTCVEQPKKRKKKRSL